MNGKFMSIVISTFIVLLSGLVLIAGIFDLPKDILNSNPLDYIFFVFFKVLFWFSLAYLINQIANRFIWGKLIVLPIGNSSKNWMRDFYASLPYTIALAIVVLTGFDLKLDQYWIILFAVVQLSITLIRPKFLSLFTSEMFARVKPFNIGDWISVKSKDGKCIATGEVFDINRGSIFIKTEDNNLIFVTTDVLAESLIENYWSFANHAKFRLKFCIDSSIPVERAKRILNAGTLQGIEGDGLMKEPAPEVLIADVNEYGIIYEIGFWIRPWHSINPNKAKDKIYSAILDHLRKSGISLAAPKLDMYHTSMPKRFTNVEMIDDRISILKNVDLLNVLTDDELEIIAKNIEIGYYNKNEMILNQNEKGDSMYILVEGILDVFVKSEQGEEIQVGKLTPGDFFGEMSLLTGEPRSASIKSRSESLVFKVNKTSLSPILEQRAVLAEEFGKVISERQSSNIEKLTLLQQQKHPGKFENIVNKIISFFQLK